MGDALFPADAPMLAPAWRNAVENPIVVQFLHRWFAFVAAAGLVALAVRAIRSRSPNGVGAGWAVIALVCFQILLGIGTLLSGVLIGVAVWHQANAALLLIAAVAAAHAVGTTRRRVSLTLV